MDTLGTLTAEQRIFYELTMLKRARKAQIAYQWGKKTNIPKNGGNQCNWRRLEALSLSTSALTEGVNPAVSSMTITSVSATVSQYGNFVAMSDQILRMGVDQLMAEASLALGQNGGESVEQLVFNALSANTGLIYATGSTKGGIATSNPITLSLIRQAVAKLEANNCPKFSGPIENTQIGVGYFIGLIHPYAVYDMLSDSELKNAFQYHSNDRLFQGNVGRVYNVEFYQSTLAPIYSAAGSAGANVYGTMIFGPDFFGVVDVDGSGKFEQEVKDLGSAGTADALSLVATVGWKAFQAPTILNNNFGVQILHGSGAPGA